MSQGADILPGPVSAEFLALSLPLSEYPMWAALGVTQREKAVRRIKALDDWILSKGAIDVKQAAKSAGVKSVTRMYEMGREWRNGRSLKAVGAFAGAPKTRVSRVDGAIRKVLDKVYDADPDGSVRKLALDLQAASGIPEENMPSHNTFRRYIEEERRQRLREAKAGKELMLDCAACTLTPTDPELLTVFTVLDRGTQVVLGAAFGNAAESMAGYAKAAADSRRRLAAGQFDRMPWVDVTTNLEIVVGIDALRWEHIREEFLAIGIRAHVQPSTRDKRFGRYLRPVTGLRIGSLVILPSHTDGRGSMANLVRPSVTSDHHQARLAIEVDEYNAALLAEVGQANVRPVPRDVQLMLEFMASDRSS